MTSAALARAVGFRPLYFPSCFCLRHTFSLTFQQQTTLEFSDGRQHGHHQLAGGIAGVDPLTTHAEHDQADATAIQVVHNP
jgi:hypothetical protein